MTFSHSRLGTAFLFLLEWVLHWLRLRRLPSRWIVDLHLLVWRGVEGRSDTSWDLREPVHRQVSTQSLSTCIECWRKDDTSLRSVRWSVRVQLHDRLGIGHLNQKWEKECSLWIGLASMPHYMTIKPRNLPNVTPNEHLVGLSFILYFECLA